MTSRGCLLPRSIMEKTAFGGMCNGQHKVRVRLILDFDIRSALIRHGVLS